MRKHAFQNPAEHAQALGERVLREKSKRLPGAPLPRDVVRLPMWPEPVRAIPNGFLRSALFGAIANGRRRHINGELLAAVEGIEIRYKGECLDQGDLNVWVNVLHAVRLQALGDRCRLTSYALLKMMGKTDTGKNRTKLQEHIERLRACAITMKQGRYTFIGGLIDAAHRDEKTKKWEIEVNTKMRELYEADQFTQIEWAVRHSLDGHPLAQWLHGYYASHAQPYALTVQRLRELCGSQARRMDHFRDTLCKALDALCAVSEGFSYSFRGNLLHVKKKGSRAQKRHLEKKNAAKRKSRSEC